MSAFDNLNYGSASSLMGSTGNYDPTQFNAVGESLSQTPLANGAPISNDYSNDNRDSMDFKKQLRQANQDTANVYDDGDDNDDDHIVLNDGTKMKKVDDSHLATGMEAAAGFLTNYLAHMSDDASKAVAAGAMGAGQAVSIHEDMIKRQNMIKDLDNKTDSFGNPLYNSIDLMKWRDTGDTKDLIANQGKWLSDGNGWMHNDLTGQSRQIEGYQSRVPNLQHVDTGDSIQFVDAGGNVVNTIPKGMTPKDAAKLGANDSLDNSGDDGTGSGNAPIDSAHMKIVDPDGTEWTVATRKNGTPIVDAKTGMATVFDKHGRTSSRIYNQTYLQQSGQIAQNGLNAIDTFKKSGLNDYSGGSLLARGERSIGEAFKGTSSNIDSHIEEINGAIKAFYTNKLIQEGVRPTEELVREEVGQAGYLNKNNTPERNQQILDHYAGVFNTGVHAARLNQTHTSMDENNSSTAKRNPVTESAANAAKQGSKDHSNLW